MAAPGNLCSLQLHLRARPLGSALLHLHKDFREARASFFPPPQPHFLLRHLFRMESLPQDFPFWDPSWGPKARFPQPFLLHPSPAGTIKVALTLAEGLLWKTGMGRSTAGASSRKYLRALKVKAIPESLGISSPTDVKKRRSEARHIQPPPGGTEGQKQPLLEKNTEVPARGSVWWPFNGPGTLPSSSALASLEALTAINKRGKLSPLKSTTSLGGGGELSAVSLNPRLGKSEASVTC